MARTIIGVFAYFDLEPDFPRWEAATPPDEITDPPQRARYVGGIRQNHADAREQYALEEQVRQRFGEALAATHSHRIIARGGPMLVHGREGIIADTYLPELGKQVLIVLFDPTDRELAASVRDVVKELLPSEEGRYPERRVRLEVAYRHLVSGESWLTIGTSLYPNENPVSRGDKCRQLYRRFVDDFRDFYQRSDRDNYLNEVEGRYGIDLLDPTQRELLHRLEVEVSGSPSAAPSP